MFAFPVFRVISIVAAASLLRATKAMSHEQEKVVFARNARGIFQGREKGYERERRWQLAELCCLIYQMRPLAALSSRDNCALWHTGSHRFPCFRSWSVKLLNIIMKDKTHIIAHDGTCVLQVYELYVGVLLYPFITQLYHHANDTPETLLSVSLCCPWGKKKRKQ